MREFFHSEMSNLRTDNTMDTKSTGDNSEIKAKTDTVNERVQEKNEVDCIMKLDT